MCALDGDGTTLSSAALVGHDGGVWAQSSSFPEITAEETAVIMSILSTGTSETGSFLIGGVKYMVGWGGVETSQAHPDVPAAYLHCPYC